MRAERQETGDESWDRDKRWKWEMGDNMGDLGICFCYLFIFKKGDN